MCLHVKYLTKYIYINIACSDTVGDILYMYGTFGFNLMLLAFYFLSFESIENMCSLRKGRCVCVCVHVSFDLFRFG